MQSPWRERGELLPPHIFLPRFHVVHWGCFRLIATAAHAPPARVEEYAMRRKPLSKWTKSSSRICAENANDDGKQKTRQKHARAEHAPPLAFFENTWQSIWNGAAGGVTRLRQERRRRHSRQVKMPTCRAANPLSTAHTIRREGRQPATPR